MQIHQPIPHRLLYSITPQDAARIHLSEKAQHDDFEWGGYESDYFGESLANNVIAFLNEMTGK